VQALRWVEDWARKRKSWWGWAANEWDRRHRIVCQGCLCGGGRVELGSPKQETCTNLVFGVLEKRFDLWKWTQNEGFWKRGEAFSLFFSWGVIGVEARNACGGGGVLSNPCLSRRKREREREKERERERERHVAEAFPIFNYMSECSHFLL